MTVTEVRHDVRELYELHADELMRFATSIAGPSDAADLVSVAFVNALSTPKWDDVENRRAYLYRSVLNAARSSARSRTRRTKREDRVSAEQPTTNAPAPAPDPEIWAAVTALSERQRAVVYLAYWLDMTSDQIADLLDLSPGSVKKHLDRARTALRTTLGGGR